MLKLITKPLRPHTYCGNLGLQLHSFFLFFFFFFQCWIKWRGAPNDTNQYTNTTYFPAELIIWTQRWVCVSVCAHTHKTNSTPRCSQRLFLFLYNCSSLHLHNEAVAETVLFSCLRNTRLTLREERTHIITGGLYEEHIYTTLYTIYATQSPIGRLWGGLSTFAY